jgi:hypothetical protein
MFQIKKITSTGFQKEKFDPGHSTITDKSTTIKESFQKVGLKIGYPHFMAINSWEIHHFQTK